MKQKILLLILIPVFIFLLSLGTNVFATPVGGSLTKDRVQDQLVLVSEPTTILLSGLGLIFMGVFFRRKFIK